MAWNKKRLIIAILAVILIISFFVLGNVNWYSSNLPVINPSNPPLKSLSLPSCVIIDSTEEITIKGNDSITQNSFQITNLCKDNFTLSSHEIQSTSAEQPYYTDSNGVSEYLNTITEVIGGITYYDSVVPEAIAKPNSVLTQSVTVTNIGTLITLSKSLFTERNYIFYQETFPSGYNSLKTTLKIPKKVPFEDFWNARIVSENPTFDSSYEDSNFYYYSWTVNANKLGNNGVFRIDFIYENYLEISKIIIGISIFVVGVIADELIRRLIPNKKSEPEVTSSSQQNPS